MKVPVICFWVSIPPWLFVCVRAREEAEGGRQVWQWCKCMFWLAAYWSSVSGCPTQRCGLWVYISYVSMHGPAYFIDCVYVCMCVCAKGMCVKRPVPEGSRQSKGVNSSSMAKIHRSPVVNQPTDLELRRGQLFLYSSFFGPFQPDQRKSFCCPTVIPVDHQPS